MFGRRWFARERLPYLILLIVVVGIIVNVTLPYFTNYGGTGAFARSPEQAVARYMDRLIERALGEEYRDPPYYVARSLFPLEESEGSARIYGVMAQNRFNGVEGLMICLRRDWLGNWFAGDYNLLSRGALEGGSAEEQERYLSDYFATYHLAEEHDRTILLKASDCAR